MSFECGCDNGEQCFALKRGKLNGKLVSAERGLLQLKISCDCCEVEKKRESDERKSMEKKKGKRERFV